MSVYEQEFIWDVVCGCGKYAHPLGCAHVHMFMCAGSHVCLCMPTDAYLSRYASSLQG